MISQKLTKRLYEISKLVTPDSLVADIGTDHAFLPIYLIKNGITKSCIASDIVDGPVNTARKNIKEAGLEDKIKVIKSDGLDKVYSFTPENIIIAGMGGETILDIIRNCDYSKSGSPLFILQPMTHADLLRKYLIQNGYSILKESIVREQNRFYVIILARYKEKQEHYFNSDDFKCICELGAIVKDSCEDAESYLLWRKQTAVKVLNSIKDSNNTKIKEYTDLINEIDRRLCLE